MISRATCAFALALALGLGTAVQAQAQDAAATQATNGPGTKVFDPQGGEVGTIESNDGTNFVIDTGKHKATLPLASLGTGPNGPVLALTRDQLDAAVEQAENQAKAALAEAMVVDAPVHGTGGNVLGTIAKFEDENFELKTETGGFMLPKSALTLGANGLVIGMTAEQFAAATAQAQAAPAAEAPAAN